MISRYHILAERIEAELADVRRGAEKAAQAHQMAQRDAHHQTFYLDSVAINLHGVYNGIERIFEWIAREVDGGVPAGPYWHRDLLMQMTLEVKSLRPAVIRSQTAHDLEEYLRFRHLVRNLYTWNFEAGKLAALVVGLPRTLTELETDLERFGRFLKAASVADEG